MKTSNVPTRVAFASRTAYRFRNASLRRACCACLSLAGTFAILSDGHAQWKPNLGGKADPQYAMPSGTKAPYDLNASGSASQTNKIFVYSYDTDGIQVPVKTLKITNISGETIYPVIRDANEATVVVSGSTVGLYDPYDPVNTEHRGYIGYRESGTNYFGLKTGESIRVRLPLVFWNGARMGIATDGKYMAPSGTSTPNPLKWTFSATMIAAPSEPNEKGEKGMVKEGVVLWYKVKSDGPALDSPDQLVEWTIRDEEYFSSAAFTARTGGKIPASEKSDLINYDISYVDSMFLPAAIQGLDVVIPPFPPGRFPQPFGWIGSTDTVNTIQKQIKEFVKDNNSIIGPDYFGGKGWPQYNIPQNDIKIPAAQNVFANSPMNDQRSSYSQQAYILSSGGSLTDPPIDVVIGSVSGNVSTGTTIVLDVSTPENQKLFSYIEPGRLVISGTDVVQPGTVVTGKSGSNTVFIKPPLIGSGASKVYNFQRPQTDYASDAMMRLWFSWANHYLNLDTTKNAQKKDIVASLTQDQPIITFTSGSQGGLIPGMQVTGPGLPPPDPSQSKGGVIVLQVATDGKSATLSQIATQTVTSGTFTFDKPQPLTPMYSGTTLYTFKFTKTPDAARDPAIFSQKVFLVMASMNQIPKDPSPDVKVPYLYQLMLNVIGGNMGFIFPKGKETSDGAIVSTVIIRDMLKSILRGVTDFTKYPERTADGKDFVWYPDPKTPTADGIKFNVFNLDPFVRFVHVDLKYSGYGFSLDDDTADVGAPGATKLLLTVGGRPPGPVTPVVGKLTPGTPNAREWTIQAPYGTVKGKGTWDPKVTGTSTLAISGATAGTPIVITSTNHGLGNDEKVIMYNVSGITGANGTFKTGNVSKNTFQLLKPDGTPSTGTGVFTGTGQWSRGPLPYIKLNKDQIDDIYWRIKGDDRVAGFQGAYISTEGVTPTKLLRVVQLGDDKEGILMISGTLTIKKTNKPLPKGNYTWTFSGTSPVDTK